MILRNQKFSTFFGITFLWFTGVFAVDRRVMSTAACSQPVLVSVLKFCKSKLVISAVQFFRSTELGKVAQTSCCKFKSRPDNTYTQFAEGRQLQLTMHRIFHKLILCFLKLFNMFQSFNSKIVLFGEH